MPIQLKIATTVVYSLLAIVGILMGVENHHSPSKGMIDLGWIALLLMSGVFIFIAWTM